ncbi:MFS transporter [Brachybacterium hainanense]|uniref:MFS transporter n=1 Tax=Brachybacterium hainanense TaxID=1541174 RepID=A0ABV6RGC6_9MICO
MSVAPPPVPARQVLRRLVPSVYLPTVLEASGENALLPVIPLMALQLGFSVSEAAALTVVFGIASVLGPIPAGRAMSRIGAQRAIIVTGVLLVLANLSALVVLGGGMDGEPRPVHRLALVALLVVMAAAGQVWALGRQTYLGTALPAPMRARGMTLFGGMMRIGQVIGPLLGAAVMALGHTSWVFGLFATMTATATILVAVFMVPGEPGADAPRHPAPAERLARRPRRSEAGHRLDRAVLARMAVVGAGITPVMMGRVNRPVIVPLLGASLGLDATAISAIFGATAVLEIALVVPAGVLMDRYGRAAVAVPCSVLMGAGFVLLAVLAGVLGGTGTNGAVLALLLPSILIAIGNGLGSGIVMTLGIDTSPVHDRTRYLAWWNTLLGAGRLTAPLLVTAVTLLAPVAAAGAVSGVLCLLGAAWLGRTLPSLVPSGGTRRS